VTDVDIRDLFMQSIDTHVIACEPCSRSTPGTMLTIVPLTDDDVRRSAAPDMVSDEGVRHSCAFTHHALCQHVAEMMGIDVEEES
jgi:hypothetical protein